MRFRRAWIFVALVAGVLAVAGTAVEAGQTSALDASYGQNGVAKVTIPRAAAGGTEEDGTLWTRAFAGAVDGSAYVAGEVDNCFKQCRDGEYLIRFDPSGAEDQEFAGNGAVLLPEGAKNFGLLADPEGRAVVAYGLGEAVVVRRFGVDGAPDPSFGQGGAVTMPCGCGKYPQVRLLAAPGGRILVDVNYAATRGKRTVELARLIRLLPEGGHDPRFGKGGTHVLRLRRAELPRAVVATATGAVLFGLSGGPRQVLVQRVTPAGGPDPSFEGNVARSTRRLNVLGEAPSLGGIVPRGDGKIDLIGSSQSRVGFELRLNPGGGVARSFGKRGLVRLPFLIDSAIAGSGGTVFGVGATKPYGSYRIFRVLPEGRPDPAFDGAAGLPMPLSGTPARVMPGAPGRPFVTDQGRFFCRSGCVPEPSLARFRE